MAHIGMKYPVAAPLNEDGTYGQGFVIGRAINFTGTPNKNEVDLHADDDVAESDKSMKDIGTSLNVDDIELKTQAELLGHTYVEPKEGSGDQPGTPEEMIAASDDVAPYFGVGFYKRRRKNNVTTFTVIWLNKVQHGEPTENAETKGETTNFQTPTIEGKAYPHEVTKNDATKMVLMRKLVFKTEKDARDWLNKQANITEAAKA